MVAFPRTTFSNALSWMKILRVSTKISLMFIPKDSINNIPALIQIMAWHRAGDKPLSEPMMVILPICICVARPQWGNCWTNHISSRFNLVNVSLPVCHWCWVWVLQVKHVYQTSIINSCTVISIFKCLIWNIVSPLWQWQYGPALS